MKTHAKTSLAILTTFLVDPACSDERTSPAPESSRAAQTEATPDAGTPGGATTDAMPPGAVPPTLPPKVGPEPLRTTTPLMEAWKFIQDDDLSEEEALADTGAAWQTVNLPHTWNAEDAASLQARAYKRGVGWYRLEFASPEAAGRHYVEFGAASLLAEVWLNGEKLGEHAGAFTAFRFDVTDRLAQGAPNVLLVKVDNTEPEDDEDPTAIAPKLGDFNISGGLYRHVSLISAADAHFDLDHLGGPGVYAVATLTPGSFTNADGVRTGDAAVAVRARVTNHSAGEGQFVVRLSLIDHEGQAAATAEAPVQIGAGETLEVTRQLSVAGAHLWHGVADPYQYQLVAELLGPDGASVDNVSQRFGIREMHFDADQGFFLNGEQVRLRGAAIHQDFLHKGWAVSNEDVDTTLALFTEIGANFIRLGHYPFSRYTLERVSELGLVAWPETALGIRTSLQRCNQEPANERYVANAQEQLREMIRQQFNHAAIPLWSIGNESTQGQLNCGDERFDNVTPVLRAMHEVAKQEDPSRPSAYAEFPHPAERTGPFDTQNITDVFATNRYYLWYTQEFEEFRALLDDLHAQAPDQPLGISEYGGGSGLTHHTDNPLGGYPEVRSAPEGEVSYQPEEYAAYLHEQNYALLSSVPYLWGTSVWALVDFGSANRNEGDVLGVNTKGLVSFDRKTKKDPFYFYKANWSSEPVTYITSRRYTDRAYPVADVKVYSNADTVTLSVNGLEVGSLTAAQCQQRACVFEDVSLSRGVNTISAVGDHAGQLVTDSVEWSLNATDINIAAGRLATGYVSSRGTRFGSDHFFVGGDWGYIEGDEDPQGGAPEDVIRTDDPELYKYFRRGEFSYEIPLEDGRYELTLGFIEPDGDIEAGDRVFDVLANGEPLIDDLDVVDEAGGDREVITETFSVDVSGGSLVLEFTPEEGEALVSTIKVVSGEEQPR